VTDALVFFPHYWSTYCIHGLHDDCRQRCKHCEAFCLCPCHEENIEVKNAER
jgi:hypothetical protein